MTDTPAGNTQNSGLMVHETLAQGYLLYILAIIAGFALDILHPLRFSFPLMDPIGVFLILGGTALIFWAQYASGSTSKNRNTDIGMNQICKDHFCVGPYVFTRSPTQYGLALMVFGLAFIYSMTFILITGVIALLVGRFIVIRQEEKHLAEKYGEAYLEYKKQVKF